MRVPAEDVPRLPAGWTSRRGDDFLRFDKTIVDPQQLPDDAVFHYSIPAIQETGDGKLEDPGELDSAKHLIRGTRVLVSKLNPRKGVVILAEQKAVPTVASTELVPLEVLAGDPMWVQYLYMSHTVRETLSARVQSATRSHQRVDVSDIVKLHHFVPPLETQRAIATFLDRKTAEIDALVAKKERLIELLEEKRTALITHAVTKGLEPGAAMKDSGVEWLGNVPAHWEVAKMWRISGASSGGTPSKDDPGYWNGDIPWVSPKDMKRRTIDSSIDTITELALAETGLRLFEAPVVLIVVRGMILAHTFPVAVTSTAVTINQDMKALHFQDAIELEFATWFLDGVGNQILGRVVEEAAHGTRVIRMDQWRDVLMVVPPLGEQRLIATYLQRETAKLYLLMTQVRAAADRLKEYRSALITAAVTGQMQIPLPDV